MSTDFQFDNTWHLHPLDGDTGQAFMGIKDSEKLFVKCNTTPFLAALSREGLAPKLVWTKRTNSGDILTAQEWLEGDILKKEELAHRRDVIRIMAQLHRSESLRSMLFKVRGEQKTAFDFLKSYAENLPRELMNNQYLHSVFRYLEDHLPNDTTFQVCHGDPVHTNWFLSEDEEKLYLVDWDSSILADPAYDLGIILGRYLQYSKWPKWLELYGVRPDEELLEKIYWYSGIDFLLRIKHYHQQYDYAKMNREIQLLKKIYVY